MAVCVPNKVRMSLIPEEIESHHRESGEARRILKRGGVFFAAAISRFASLLDGLSTGNFRDAQFREIVAADLASGQHRNPTSHPAYFTTAYFHRPEDLAAEVREAGFG